MAQIDANPDLRADEIMGVTVGEFRILYEKFDNMLAAGPVPTFFSERPEDTLAELKKSPEWAFQCLQSLVSMILTRGQLSR